MTVDPVGKLIGAEVRRLRLERGMSQYALAVASGIHRPIISGLERGRRGEPSLPTIRRLAGALGVKPSELVAAIDDVVELKVPDGSSWDSPKTSPLDDVRAAVWGKTNIPVSRDEARRRGFRCISELQKAFPNPEDMPHRRDGGVMRDIDKRCEGCGRLFAYGDTFYEEGDRVMHKECYDAMREAWKHYFGPTLRTVTPTAGTEE